MVEPSMANPKKDLAKMIDASENLPQHYKEYLTLGENICKVIPFKDYFYFRFGFDPKDVDENSFNARKSSIEEPICSNYVSKEEERKSKREDAPKTYVGPSIMRLFGFYFSRSSKSGDRSTILENEVSSTCLENKEPLTNHPSKEKVINFPEEETCSASNGSIDEEKEEGSVGPNHLDGKDEEEDEGPNPL